MENSDDLILNTTLVTKDDAKQEAALRKLLGKKDVSVSLIFLEMSKIDRVLYYGDFHKKLDTAKLPWAGNKVDLSVVQRIIDWTLDQPPELQEVVFDFLDAEDKEAMLPEVLYRLGLSGTEDAKKAKKNNLSMSQIMRRALPATKEDLIVLIQSVSPETKRPASTVRQFLRSETKKGLIHLDDAGVYYHA